MRVEGVVQGVGFRPAAARAALGLGLAGAVRNDGDGVMIVVEGPSAAVFAFEAALRDGLAPAARVERVHVEVIVPTGATAFTIDDSVAGSGGGIPIPPDLRPCAACQAELADAADRRFGDPFISCAHCGPRWSILRALPFDRAATTMAPFVRCGACEAEYADPASRRFHAQTFACPACGPRLRLLRPDGTAIAADATAATIEATRAMLRHGAIVALQGVGGFQLVCDADDAAAVARLRQRKGRPRKALALMTRDDGADDPQGPITLRAGAAPPGVAPDVAAVGVMPPSSPLHLCLLQTSGADPPPERLVVTSGNAHGAPLLTDPALALQALGEVADAFVVHDRAIARPVDDAVVDARDDGPPLPLRLGRGCPGPRIALGADGPPTFAAGGDLAAAFALALGRDAFVSDHVGDLHHAGCVERYQRAVEHTFALRRFAPALVAVDAHPGYDSARLGRAVAAAHRAAVVVVQHHVAHVASVIADHGIGQAIGLAFDGAGHGPDGTSWGGEALLVDLEGGTWRRMGGFSASPLPGGDAAVRVPTRQTWARCAARGLAPPPWARHPELEAYFGRGAAAPLAVARSRSVGRLFDAVAGLLLPDLGAIGYSGEAALRLERLAHGEAQDLPPFDLPWAGDDIDGDAVFAAVHAAVAAGAAPSLAAARFHATIVAAGAALADRAVAASGLRVVALSGGAMANLRLRQGLRLALASRGLLPLLPRRVPPGDGGLALGQLAWARATAARGGADA